MCGWMVEYNKLAWVAFGPCFVIIEQAGVAWESIVGWIRRLQGLIGGWVIFILCLLLMAVINTQSLQNLIAEAARFGSPYQILQQFTREYQLRALIKLHEYDDLLPIAHRINARYAQRSKPNPGVFGNGELKLFSWVLMLYCQSKELLLHQFNPQDLANVQQIFINEELERIDYEVRCFAVSKTKHDLPWTEPEVTLFTRIALQHKGTEWKTIAFLMFKLSHGLFFRPFEHYREKWINYLNPKLEKGKWSLPDSLNMMRIIVKHGRKWALVSRELQHSRSEHSIKNHFKKLLREFCKAASLKQDAEDLDQKILHHLAAKLKARTQSAPVQFPLEDSNSDHLPLSSQSKMEEQHPKVDESAGLSKKAKGCPSRQGNGCPSKDDVVERKEGESVERGRQMCLKQDDCENYSYIVYGEEVGCSGWVKKEHQNYYPFFFPFLPPY